MLSTCWVQTNHFQQGALCERLIKCILYACLFTLSHFAVNGRYGCMINCSNMRCWTIMSHQNSFDPLRFSKSLKILTRGMTAVLPKDDLSSVFWWFQSKVSHRCLFGFCKSDIILYSHQTITRVICFSTPLCYEACLSTQLSSDRITE